MSWCTGGAQNLIDEVIALDVGLYLSGKVLQKYLHDIRKNSIKLGKKYAKGKPVQGNTVKLVESDTESSALDSVISALIYEQSSGIQFLQIKKKKRNI